MSTSNKLISVGLAAGVIVAIGYTQANAAGTPHHTQSGIVAGAVSHGGSMRPLATAQANIVHFYNTSSTGGTGDAIFTIPNPGAGIYDATYSANFFPAGSVSAPEHFACSLLKNSKLVAQDTSISTYDSGFYIGVNGATTIKITGSDALSLYCGTDDDTSWEWGTKPATVSLTKEDGLVVGSMTQNKSDSHPSGAATTR